MWKRGNDALSSTSTAWPCRAMMPAHVAPAGPAPTTIASNVSGVCTGLLIVAPLLRGSLDPDDHGIWPHQPLHARVAKPGLPHPRHAVRARVVEAARRLDQHVQAHQEPERVLAAR